MEIVEGEERYLNLGATGQHRILLVVTTWREDRVGVVTAFEPIKRLIQFTTRNERGDLLWTRKSHPSRLRNKRPNGGRKIRTLSRTASSEPKPRANSAREPLRELPANGPAKPELRQRSQSGWREMTSREPEPSPPRRGCGTRRTSKCCCTKL